ncbi:MAG TPA: SpoIIE family protein phosphatase [Solirubrobacteraceae bacterium]|jgi:serine phosphatase RsbU (regulator of sigma subunit)/anti-sigma regulatory factor (Ser/Thr protein kinase)|nr:SpoIIE family protein phosphatase [Solirubrobacteraceae bacterium]
MKRSTSEQRLEELERLTDSSLAYLSLEELLAELLERVRLGLAADTAAVLLLDHERGVLVARAAKGIEEEVRQGVQVPLGRGFAGRIAAEQRPIILDRVIQPEIVNPILEQKGIRSLLGVPLVVEGRVIGVLHVGTLVPREFTDEDVSLMQLTADRAAMAIDNAQLSEQRAVTQVMQRTLLPEALPSVPGLRFSAKYLPAGSGIKIGGDWYDVFQLPDGRVTFVIGDVVGRGVVAASVMAEIRTALRAYLMEGHELGAAMSLLNELLVSMSRNRSATAAIFALDLESEELLAVSAGHLPALLLAPGEPPSYVAMAQGIPLGVSPGQVYEPVGLSFPAGGVLLLYTDGLIERRGESLDAGLDRLSQAASTAADAGRLTFADRVYFSLIQDVPLEDDVALLAIESVPIGTRLELTLSATPSVLVGLRRTVARWLIRQGVPPDVRFDIVVAVSEAAGNAIEHAYGPGDASFTIEGEYSGEEVRVTVRDTGEWRRTTRSGRGRGLTIMRQLMDSTEVEHSESGTSITLAKRLGGDS